MLGKALMWCLGREKLYTETGGLNRGQPQCGIKGKRGNHNHGGRTTNISHVAPDNHETAQITVGV